MRDDEASQTALGVALMRAAHQVIDTKPLLFEDPVALALLGRDGEAAIRARLAWLQSPYGRGLRSHICLRSRFAEDRLRQAKADRYVLVGAGFDSFAWRQPDWAKGLRILEIDHPATQQAKRERIAAAGLAMPDNLSFAAVDFARESLAEVLARQAIGAEEVVYFSWLGVCMYLDAAAIDAALAAMAGACDHPQLCLTFKQRDASPGDAAMGAAVAAMGEAFVSFFTPAEMADKLAGHGFTGQEFLWPEQAVADYFTPPRPGLPSPRHCGIARAWH